MTDFIELEGTRTACEVAGSGPPLLMLHGAEGSRRQFAAVRPALEERFTVITYDQRDCGETVNPEAPVSLAMLADDARALLRALGLPTAHVFGTSFGGRVAQVFALRHAACVRRLVLASTWPLPVSIAAVNGAVVEEMARLRARLPDSAEALAEIFFPAAFLVERPAYRDHFKSAPARSPRSARRMAVTQEVSTADLGRIDRPTLVIAGALDRVVPPDVTKAFERDLPDVESVVLDGVGHLASAQAPDRLAAHLCDFLERPVDARAGRSPCRPTTGDRPCSTYPS